MNRLLTIQDVALAREYYAKGYWRPDTFYTLLRDHANKTPDKMALRDTNSRLSYQQTLHWVDSLAADLHAAGLREGDRVSIWSPSRVESAIALLACSRMGYVCNTSLHRDNTVEEVLELMERAQSAALIAQPGYGADSDRNDIFAFLPKLSHIKTSYKLTPLVPERSEGDCETRFEGLRPLVSCDLPHRTNPDRAMYLAFTSGTTGQPKGVMHSDNTILSNARPFVKDWRFSRDTILYTLSPMSHNIGAVGLATMLAVGGEFVTHTQHDAKRTLDRLLEIGATSVLGVPTHAIDVMNEARARGLSRLGSVTSFQSGGAANPPSLINGLLALGVRPKNGFGMTENCSFQYTRPDDPSEIIVNTCGRPSEGVEVCIFDQDKPDQEAPAGEIGELGFRGPCLMLGYFNDQVATEKAFNAHGWFMTGDLAQLDPQGNLKIAGRKKDLIIRGGHNIHPSKIENFATLHANVIKAAAFPVRDDRLGERVCLAVIGAKQRSVDPDDLLRHLERCGLSKFDMPEYFLDLETFPLTPSGKVLKRELTNLVSIGALTPTPIRFVASKTNAAPP